MQARKRLCSAHGLEISTRKLQVTSTASSEAGPALEAFAYRHDEGETFPARFLRHRTVFPRDFLADLGFRTLRTAGRIELMRLELGGIVQVEDESSAVARAWAALRTARAGTMPAPVR